MTLPRFTSGQVGRLDFATLNDAFGYIDEVRGASPDPRRAPIDGAPIIARIGSTGADLGVPTTTPGLAFIGHYWNEVVGPSWDNLPGGRASGDLTTGNPVDAVQFPALSLDGKTLNEGAIAILFPTSSQTSSSVPESRPFYAALQIPEGQVPMRIDSNVLVSGTTGRWRYTVTKMRWNFISDLYEPIVPATQFIAYNTLELLVDGSPANSFGVGSIKPSTASVTRQPIKTGAVVMATQLGSTWHFSIPNGYGVSCG